MEAWKHYHHHRTWLEPLTTRALVLHDRAPLSNARPTRSLITPSPVATVAAATSLLLRTRQVKGENSRMGGRQMGDTRLHCGPCTSDIDQIQRIFWDFRGNRVQFVSMAVNLVTLQPHGSMRAHVALPSPLLRKTWREHIPVETKSCLSICETWKTVLPHMWTLVCTLDLQVTFYRPSNFKNVSDFFCFCPWFCYVW